MNPQNSVGSPELHKRKIEKYSDPVAVLNTNESLNKETQKKKKTYGRTSDGVSECFDAHLSGKPEGRGTKGLSKAMRAREHTPSE